MNEPTEAEREARLHWWEKFHERRGFVFYRGSVDARMAMARELEQLGMPVSAQVMRMQAVYPCDGKGRRKTDGNGSLV